MEQVDTDILQNHNLSAAEIIDIITNEKYNELNQVYVMEVSDKIKGGKIQCQKACRLIL
mgnify:CR=1 FL=1